MLAGLCLFVLFSLRCFVTMVVRVLGTIGSASMLVTLCFYIMMAMVVMFCRVGVMVAIMFRAVGTAGVFLLPDMVVVGLRCLVSEAAVFGVMAVGMFRAVGTAGVLGRFHSDRVSGLVDVLVPMVTVVRVIMVLAAMFGTICTTGVALFYLYMMVVGMVMLYMGYVVIVPMGGAVLMSVVQVFRFKGSSAMSLLVNELLMGGQNSPSD